MSLFFFAENEPGRAWRESTVRSPSHLNIRPPIRISTANTIQQYPATNSTLTWQDLYHSTLSVNLFIRLDMLSINLNIGTLKWWHQILLNLAVRPAYFSQRLPLSCHTWPLSVPAQKLYLIVGKRLVCPILFYIFLLKSIRKSVHKVGTFVLKCRGSLGVARGPYLYFSPLCNKWRWLTRTTHYGSYSVDSIKNCHHLNW